MSPFGRGKADRPISVEDGDGERLERIQRAFDQELASSTSLNIRGSSLGGFAAIALLLTMLFAAIWLDDTKYEFTDVADLVLRVGLFAVGAGFAGCVVFSLVATTPRGTWRGGQSSRVDLAAHGSVVAEAGVVAQALEKQRVRNDGKSRWLQLASLCMAFALLAVVAQALAFTLGSDVRDQRTTATGPIMGPAAIPLGVDEQRALARQHAPVVWLHSKEEYKPMRVATFLRGAQLTWRTRRGNEKIVAARGAVAARRLGRGCDPLCYSVGGYLASELTRPFFERDRPVGLERKRGFALDLADPLRRGEGPGAPMLYEIGVRKAVDELRISYWFFYGFSVPYRAIGEGGKSVVPLFHEGDWENIDVVFGLANGAPRRVEFAAHGGKPARVEWADLERTGSGRSHPVVYSARNSHASYPDAAPRRTAANELCIGGSKRLCSVELRDRGTRWAPWEEAEAGLLDAVAQPWYGFGGAWGKAGEVGDATGPLGPSVYKLRNDRN
jgi:hypothetical protein